MAKPFQKHLSEHGVSVREDLVRGSVFSPDVTNKQVCESYCINDVSVGYQVLNLRQSIYDYPNSIEAVLSG